MTLVVGATGMVGIEICRLLSAAGQPIRALVRATSAPDKVDKLKAMGATVILGDLRDAGSLKAACHGVQAVVTTASAMPFAYEAGSNTPQSTDEDGYLSLVTIALDAGVQRFVYTSFPPLAPTFPLQDAKRAVEKALHASGLVYTILQPTYFAEIWLSPAGGFDYPNRRATIYGTGDNAISWVSFLDVAQFAAASVNNPKARNATFELGGPHGVSPSDVVRIFERVAGKAFDVTHVPVEALRAQLAGASDPMQKSYAGLMLGYASHTSIEMADTLKIFPLRLRSVDEYAKSVMPQ